jgi:cytochrome c
MDSFEWNKIAGAVLGTCLLVFGLKLAGGGLFSSEVPAKPGYAIAVADAQSADAKPADAAAPSAPAVSLGTLLASADKASGEVDTKACQACHDFTKGGPNKIGPNLYGVVGRNMASVDGFSYSTGFKAMGGKPWTYEELNQWIKNPKYMVKDTKMAFAGIPSDKTRADVLAYLGSLSDSPVPFPAP